MMADDKIINQYRKIYYDIKIVLADRTLDKTLVEVIELLDQSQEYLENIFDNAHEAGNPLVVEQFVTSELVEFIIPRADDLLLDPNVIKNDDMSVNAYRIWEKAFALASRRSFHHFLLFMEIDRAIDKQVYSNRTEVLRGMSYYLNKMHYEKENIDLIASFPPGYGKSFLANYFSAWVFGTKRDNSILRMSYSDDLLNGFSRSIKDLILSGRYQQIFTGFQRHGNKPFDKNKDSDWLLKDADTLVSHYTRTRDGSVTGIRANSYIIIDDIVKGADESNNDRLFEKYWDEYMTAWSNRKQDEFVKELTVGTMWNPKDHLGRKGALLASKYEERDGKFPYAKEYLDEQGVVRGVIIRVPLLDDNNESTCDAVYSTEKALEIKAQTDPFLFSCVYQQDPIAPTGRAFAYENLRQYEMFGNKLTYHTKEIQLNDKAYAALDPVRKGRDNIAMPIFRVDVEEPDDHYLVDVLFKGKSMDEVYDDIVEKVIAHNIVDFVVENNIDVSLKAILTDRLHAKGYYKCEITEKYNTKNKMLRIKDESHFMKTKLIYPAQGIYSPNSEMGKFMENVTRFSFDMANRHDDAPDAVALYVADILKGGSKATKAQAVDFNSLFA